MNDNRLIKALDRLDYLSASHSQRAVISFQEFLQSLINSPRLALRNVFQAFHDMVQSYISQGDSIYLGDQQTVSLVDYDCSRLFEEGTDNPFFTDMIFANRLVRMVENFKRGAQQNKIYVFDGPPGCGKSTFLNNLLKKFEEYSNSDEGVRYEVLWRLDRKALGDTATYQPGPFLERLYMLLDDAGPHRHGPGGGEPPYEARLHKADSRGMSEPYLDVPCPSHDHPVLIIPKAYRRDFLDDLLPDGVFKEELFEAKEYEWVFREEPCTICLSLYQALLEKLGSPRSVFGAVYARPYMVSRRMGEGISVYSPGDQGSKSPFVVNQMLERRVNNLLKESYHIRYLYSRYAQTNNGVYALMDIKSKNTGRLVELHNIVSEGVHKLDNIEEKVNSLFLAVMNPEDKENIKDKQSFLDRIQYVNIPYVLDYNTEVKIFLSVFGQDPAQSFLPRVLLNFARIIVATRLQTESRALTDWLGDPGKYELFCDSNLHLLKMELYAGSLPSWLNAEDIKSFSPKVRRKLWLESDKDGCRGLSGRDSIKAFSDFYSGYSKNGKLINMTMLYNFFTKVRKDLLEYIPKGFLDSLLSLYDYNVLQQVKESLYYFNEERISRDIQNYIFALNFEQGSTVVCEYTGEKLEITGAYLREIEDKLIGRDPGESVRADFRSETQSRYTSRTLTQEMMVGGVGITDTKLYRNLYERYVHNIKSKVLDPFIENANFRRAIKDFGEEDFRTYDRKIRHDVSFMMGNLQANYNYTPQGAKEICIDIIDRDLARKFSEYNS